MADSLPMASMSMKDDFQLVACVHPVQGQANEVTCHVQLRPPEATERTPLDVVCVVDTSGSMCVNASLQGADGAELENDNLEILDLAKHSLATVIESLQPGDRLALVSVRAAPGRLSALGVFLCKSVLYGAFVWARRALNRQKRRFPARADPMSQVEALRSLLAGAGLGALAPLLARATSRQLNFT